MPRLGLTVMPIFGRFSLSVLCLSGGGEFSFDLGKLFRRPLDLGSLEPVLGREEPVAPGVDQDYGDRDYRVVERCQGVSGGGLREHEEDGDEGDPDHCCPADQVAPSAEVPRAALEPLAGEKPEQDWQ